MKSESRLEKILSAGKFAVTAELGPPKSADTAVINKKAAYLKDVVDAVNVTDNQTAIVRMFIGAACSLIINLGLEPILQMVCRDRNRIAMQSDILGASALGIKNMLCLSGDHQKFGNHPQAKNVYDMDSVQLIGMVKKMRDEKKFFCGDEIKVEPRMFIGAAENPFGDPFEFRAVRLEKKINAGADFFQTQAVFDIDKFEKWMEMVRARGLHKKAYILAGVVPLKSAKAATYMKNEVAGIGMPDAVIERLQKAADAKEEGIKICVETIERVKKIEGISGVHIMAIEWESMVPAIAEKAGLLPRPGVN
ncbi:MAG: methylenetetrahydrofolate reductase [Firmicutes bacterium]|nr:methylenetetrahydrofolate reductase [Bacillota bacterium]